jgi:hypothetical protein
MGIKMKITRSQLKQLIKEELNREEVDARIVSLIQNIKSEIDTKYSNIEGAVSAVSALDGFFNLSTPKEKNKLVIDVSKALRGIFMPAGLLARRSRYEPPSFPGKLAMYFIDLATWSQRGHKGSIYHGTVQGSYDDASKHRNDADGDGRLDSAELMDIAARIAKQS